MDEGKQEMGLGSEDPKIKSYLGRCSRGWVCNPGPGWCRATGSRVNA